MSLPRIPPLRPPIAGLGMVGDTLRHHYAPRDCDAFADLLRAIDAADRGSPPAAAAGMTEPSVP